MLRDSEDPQNSNLRALVLGNYCHDVILRDGAVVGEAIGGAATFISAVLDSFSISHHLVAKVGPDFAYVTNHPPIVIPSAETTVFHAHFTSNIDASGNSDRVLKRVRACDAIRILDLPQSSLDFGMAVGVGGEILPETLERMVEICDEVFVDVQALIRKFDVVDGTVKPIALKESGFFHLLPRIGFLKASADEALFIDLEEMRKFCCVVVTHGKEGCRVYWKDGDMEISPFTANQVDPTGAGDSFLGGFVSGLIQGLAVSDAAILGNFFGSLTVSQLGPPKLDIRLFQMVKDEIHIRRKIERKDNMLNFEKAPDEEQFYASLAAAKAIIMRHIQEHEGNPPSSPTKVMKQDGMNKKKLLLKSVQEESTETVDGES
ncbi:inositol 3-kinase-like isoform X1 [Prosopis cineraria]|uniref:inositol 3-kinase-like isoform X1 n=1 Tax=Prosopis cineraria TaxID=364024 RepID=UPI00240FB2D6|nr:inositol 3-kinase-like isoform X1 [Prosopis cineraria]